MKLINKIVISYGVLLSVAGACAATAIINTNQAEYYLKLAHLAHESYESHISLSNHTYRLRKKFADAMLVGDLDQGAGEARMKKAINKDILSIHSAVQKKQKMTGLAYAEELAAIQDLKEQIESIVMHYEEYIDFPTVGQQLPSVEQLTNLLEGSIDSSLDKKIEDSLITQKNKSIETIDKSTELMHFSRSVSVFFGIFALLVSVVALMVILRSVRQPIKDLEKGAEKFAEGDWGYRITVASKDELLDIAEAFNKTARAAGEREAALINANIRLDDIVKERTQELRSALLTLEEQTKMRRRLLADVSHELRTPLTIIYGEADIALRGKTKSLEEYQEALRRTRDAAKHTSGLVNDVLFIARQEAGKNRVNKATCNFNQLIIKTLSTMDNVIQERGVQISYDFFNRVIFLEIDENRIRQVILVLFENACQYGATKISINVKVRDNVCQFSLKDNGPGIEKSDQKNIFDRFFRGNNAAERYGGGTGLGLPVAKSIIEAHDGVIFLESSPEFGTTFFFTLPINITHGVQL